ncbi:MAG TPA: lmo0937 family membrane protein [Fimbriimonadaceae bacterium]|nr:lmo0937 family membrane protein [Fimbriimonadaceae bacterium]
MLWTIVAILIALWLIGMISGATFSGFLHILLVLAVIVVILRLLEGRRTI